MPRRPALAIIAFIAATSGALAATLTTSDGTCQWRVTYDAANVDRGRLQATLDYLAAGEPARVLGPSLNEPKDVATLDLGDYRKECAERRAAIARPVFLDIPDVEAVRKAELATFDDVCALHAARLAAAKGDLQPARAYAPAAACTTWLEAMATPNASLRRVFDDHLADLCRGSTEPNICMGQMQRDEEKAPREARMRLILLGEGWEPCASAHIKDDDGKRREALRDSLFRRFKAKALSCAQ